VQASIVNESGKLVLRVAGNFNFDDNKEWRTLAEGMLKEDATYHVLDITRLEMVDSAGLGMMLTMKQWAEDGGRCLQLRYDDSTMIGGMIRLAKFDTMFEIDMG